MQKKIDKLATYQQMTNRILLALFAAVVAFGGYVTWLFVNRDPQRDCDHAILAEAVSPDSKYTAFFEMGNCGVLASGNEFLVEKLAGDAKPVRVTLTSWEPPCKDQSCATIQWTSPTSIVASLCVRWGEGHYTALIDDHEITVDIINTCREANASRSNAKK